MIELRQNQKREKQAPSKQAPVQVWRKSCFDYTQIKKYYRDWECLCVSPYFVFDNRISQE